MLYSVLAIVEKSVVGQEVGAYRLCESGVVHGDGVARDGLKPDASYGRCLRAEICLQQTLRQSDALKYLCSAV